MTDIEKVMLECIAVAKENNTPFGAALINKSGEVLEIAANTGKVDGPTAHAEMNVLKHAHKYPNQSLHLITTCEPCPMCAGAAVWAKVEHIYYGASIADAADYLNQIHISCSDIIQASGLNTSIKGDILRTQCVDLFKS